MRNLSACTKGLLKVAAPLSFPAGRNLHHKNQDDIIEEQWGYARGSTTYGRTDGSTWSGLQRLLEADYALAGIAAAPSQLVQ